MPKVTFITADEEMNKVEVDEGSTVMEAAINNMVPGIDGDCGGAAACGTCMVHVDTAFVDKVGGPASDMESEMLSLTDDVSDTSRLGCQITITDEMDGLTLRLPRAQH